MKRTAVVLAGAISAFSGTIAIGIEPSVLRDGLRRDVAALAGEIGPRSLFQGKTLATAEQYVATELAHAGWDVKREVYAVGGIECANLVAEKAGSTKPGEIMVIGAHYDTVPVTPGADDNASGVAVLLALARELSATKTERTLRLVAFANEEPIYFQTEFMGSRVYARGCKVRHERIVAMLSLECLGYFREEKNSQKYPFPLNLTYPSRGDFVAVVGNWESKALVKQVKRSIKNSRAIPCESIAMPDLLPGIGWSDHWSFWQEGYPAVMLTDTALNRNPNYHRVGDLPDTLNYEKMAATVRGVVAATLDLVNR